MGTSGHLAITPQTAEPPKCDNPKRAGLVSGCFWEVVAHKYHISGDLFRVGVTKYLWNRIYSPQFTICLIPDCHFLFFCFSSSF